MGTWSREIAGWVILGLGLLVIYQVYAFLLNRWFIEGGILATCAFLLMRTGTHLLKAATASRAASSITRPSGGVGSRGQALTAARLAGRARSSVVPGPQSTQ